MTLQSGARIGPYEIQGTLGAGGMGEVYRARDTRVSRLVAIKVLGASDSRASTQQRFAQEAKALSGLNHPHICAFCDIGEEDGVQFLVMEYLKGETLASRLHRGGKLSIDEALRYAIEIADALDHAHRCGVVHRDLKPSNIMLTRSGAKLLDFGLAKRRAPAIVGDVSDGPQSTQSLTIDGAILGTPSYMAPEQLHGADADARTDIFAFGQVVYEMLTGRRAFDGASQASVIAAILERNPEPLSASQTLAPPLLESILMRCLAKAPDDRWQTASDLGQALTWIAQGATETTGISDARRVRRSGLPGAWLAGLLVVIAAVTMMFIFRLFRNGLPDVDPIRFVISPPEGTSFTQSSAFMALSPDGRSLAFVTSSQGGQVSLWIRSLDSLTAHEIASGGVQPFWSPDSRFIGFYVRGKLEKIDAAGGVAQTLADSLSQPGAWSRDGVILFRPKSDGGLSQISAAGGPTTAVTSLDHSLGETSHEWPQFLPDGRHFVYLARSTEPEHDSVLYLASIDSRERVPLFRSDSQVTYVPPGFLISMAGNALLARPFDASRLRVTGEPMAIADHVERNPDSHRGAFSVSQTGVLAYRSLIGDTELVWFDRTGQRMQKLGAPARYSNPALSPDNRQLAVARVDPETGTTDIWLYELARTVFSRFTLDPASDDMPLWTPDGSHIVFKSSRNKTFAFYQQASSGSGPDEVMLSGLGPQATPLSWSPDGQFLVFAANGGPQRNALWLLPSFGDRKPFPYLRAPVNELQGQVSPNGRWMAYESNESGRNEVYVRSFPSGEGRRQISTNGGLEPAWRSDGNELFFLAANQDLMAVAVKPNSISDAGAPTRLFGTAMEAGTIMTTYTRNQYVVAADGQRFLINQSAGPAPNSPVTVIVNWAAALKK
jgi:serine/threonine protein kinase